MADKDEIDGPRTSGMVALIPSAEDAERLAIAGGEDPDKLHVTLLYLGDDVTDWDDATVDQLTDELDRLTTELGGQLPGRIIGPGHFNVDGGPDGDKDPAAVYLLSDAPGLVDLQHQVKDAITRLQRQVPDQYDPYLPHVTAGYKMDPTLLTEAGPVAFDRLRLALAGQEIDFPLGEPFQELDDDYAAPEPIPLDDQPEAKTAPHAARPPELAMPGLEVKVASPDPRAAKLRRYWAHGEGLKKWFRGLKVPGNFRRLRRHLAKYVHTPKILNGLTANIYHLATGTWPGRRGGKSHPAVTTIEIKSLFGEDPADVVDDVLDPGESALCEGIDDWGAEFADLADGVADPDGLDDLGEAAPADVAEVKGILEPADIRAGLEVKSIFDTAIADGDMDQLLLNMDQFELLAGQLVSTDELKPDDPDDESWTEVVDRDRPYQVGPGAELEPVTEHANISRRNVAAERLQPGALM